MEKIMHSLNIIYILWVRQLKRYFRSKARMISSLGQPILFLIALGFGFGPIFQKAGGGDYIQFLAPGIIAMSVIFTAMFSGIEIIIDKQFGFLKETLVAPVPRLLIMIGRTLGGATVAMIQGIVVFLISLLVGFNPIFSITFLLSIIFVFLVAVFFTALGTAIGSLLEDMHAFPIIMNFLIMPLFFLSGALFPLENLPSFIQIIASANPFSYGVDGLRGVMTGISYFGLWADFWALLFFDLVVLIIGAKLFSRIKG